MTEPQQGATYDDLLSVARESERLGFDAFFRSDHLQRIGPGDPGPGSTDAWVTLAGLARDTSRIRLGTMVSSATFRLPGPLAIAVATVDAMSGGRVELGLGTGWFETEHRSYGIRFPPTAERFDVLEEQLAVVTGLWRTPTGDTFSFAGTTVTVIDSPALPKPVQQPHPPVLIGGKGRRRTPELAARFAAEYNVPFDTEHVTAQCFDRARRACRTPAVTRPHSSSRPPSRSRSVRPSRPYAAELTPSAHHRTSCADPGWPARWTRSSTRSGGSPRWARHGSTSN